MRAASAILCTAALLSAGCASASERTQRVDDALLSEVSASQMALVQQARAARDEAVDGLAKAARDAKWAVDQAELAQVELRTTTQQLEEAKLAAVLAERNGKTMELQDAKRRQERMVAMADASREKLALRKRESEYMRLTEKVALEHRRLADAEVELAKARAVQDLDRVAAQKVPVREFEKQVNFHKTEVKLAEVRAIAAQERVQEAKVKYEAAESKAARSSDA